MYHKKNLKRLRVKFNVDNVIILTEIFFPMYVRFIASLGAKFSYRKEIHASEFPRFLIVYEKLREKVDSFLGWNKFKKKRDDINKKLNGNSFPGRIDVRTDESPTIYYLTKEEN